MRRCHTPGHRAYAGWRDAYTVAVEPVHYVDLLNQRYQQQGFPPYEWTVNTEAPLTTPAKPLADSHRGHADLGRGVALLDAGMEP